MKLGGCLTGVTAGTRPWSAADDEVIRARYRKGAAAGIAADLGRTTSAVRERARKMRALAERRWTAAEETILRDQWGELSLRQFAHRFNRTTKGIYQHARLLGIVNAERARSESVTEAAARTGFGRRKLMEILRAHRVANPVTTRFTTKNKARPYYLLDPFDVDEAVAAYLETETIGAAARRHDTNNGLVIRALARVGVKRPASKAKRRHWRLDSATIDEALSARRAA